MTNTFETYVLNAARGITTQAPGAVYVGLLLSNPTETGTAGTEVSYSGYARQAVTLSTPTADGTTVSCQNTGQIIFPTPNAASGTAMYAALYDASVGGNMLVYKALPTPIVLTSETSPRFNEGEIVLTMAGGDMDPAYKQTVLNFLRGTNLAGFTPYLALYNGDPTASGTELSGTEYARLPLVFSQPSEQVSGQMQIANSNAAQSNPANSNWGTWSYGVIMTAETGGDRYYYKQNVAAYPMNNGAQAYITAGAISVSIN